ncbi:copia protein [Tanacetum coccineum]
MKVEESLNVTFDETLSMSKTSPLEDDDLVEEEAIEVSKTRPLGNNFEDKSLENNEIINIKESKSHPLENVIEVYVAQPPGFIDFTKPNHVYRLKKALYGLKQAPKAWPDIMFSVFFCARFQEGPKTSQLEAVKRIFRYVKGTIHLGLWYPKGSGIETIVYADSDHAGDYVDRKSTSGIFTFKGCCLTSWFSNKQTDLAISTTEAEYVSAKNACWKRIFKKRNKKKAKNKHGMERTKSKVSQVKENIT